MKSEMKLTPTQSISVWISCPVCCKETTFTETPQSVHYGRIDCKHCNKFIKWVPNPENTGIRTKTSKQDNSDVCRFYGITEPFCFFCLRKPGQFGIHETITIDHIQELSKGGKDELRNLQFLCSACHKLKNWARLYMNWHLTKVK